MFLRASYISSSAYVIHVITLDAQFMKSFIPQRGVKRATTIPSYSHTARRHISIKQLRDVCTLTDPSIEAFREHAFKPGTPMLLPAGYFEFIPAISKWFDSSTSHITLNPTYLAPHGNTIVPLEATITDSNGLTTFTRSEQPLAVFLAFTSASQDMQSTTSDKKTSVYLAQCPLNQLPQELRLDLPIPEFVTQAGRGDIYDSSIWLGRAPTYTPLHKDPNPNLFVQLAGRKAVRIFAPAVGNEIFASVKNRLGDGGRGQMRGEEMMGGEERKVLEEVVWSEQVLGPADVVLGQEAVLEAGDGIFIPKGWWHSIKGVGEGVIGSVSTPAWCPGYGV